MPVANNKKRQRTRNIAATTSAKNTKWQMGILIICLVVAAIGLGAFFTPKDSAGDEMSHEGDRMVKYLNEKYGQEFVIENVRETGTGFAVKGSWRGDAYPKSDPSLKFEIRRDQVTDIVDYETFLQVLWTRQGTPEVEEFLAKEFPNQEYYSLRISPGNSPRSPLYDLIKGETPSLNYALKNHKDLMVYELVVHDVIEDTSNEPSPQSLGRVLKIVNFVKSKEVRMPSLRYWYRDFSFAQKNSNAQQKHQYGIKIEHEQLQNISSPNDLTQYFQAISH